jgi:hypothetical protein
MNQPQTPQGGGVGFLPSIAILDALTFNIMTTIKDPQNGHGYNQEIVTLNYETVDTGGNGAKMVELLFTGSEDCTIKI